MSSLPHSVVLNTEYACQIGRKHCICRRTTAPDGDPDIRRSWRTTLSVSRSQAPAIFVRISHDADGAYERLNKHQDIRSGKRIRSGFELRGALEGFSVIKLKVSIADRMLIPGLYVHGGSTLSRPHPSPYPFSSFFPECTFGIPPDPILTNHARPPYDRTYDCDKMILLSISPHASAMVTEGWISIFSVPAEREERITSVTPDSREKNNGPLDMG